MEPEGFICKVPGCGGPLSGVCINGLSFDECPDVVAQDIDKQAPESAPPQAPLSAQVAMVKTGGIASLDAIACDALLRISGGTVVGIVAGPEVGKTTMIATMYELLHRRRMQDFGFAGSETLRGYEERSYLSRFSSNADSPDTERTKVGAKLSFTHLRLATGEGIKNVIFSDRSGEHFENVLNTPNEIGSFSELDRADVIVLMVDLKQLKDSPHQTVSTTRRLFLAMQQQNLLANKTVRLVGTKADLMTSEGDLQKVTDSLNALADDLTRRSVGVIQVRPLLISSRARVGTTEIGTGLEALLSDALQPRPLKPNKRAEVWPPKTTELDLLMQPFWRRKK